MSLLPHSRLRPSPTLALLACAAPAASMAPASEVAPPRPPAQWTTEIVLRAPDKLGGCAVGELDAGAAGAEIAAVSRDGRFYVVSRATDGWRAADVFQSSGEMIQCAVGDADPTRAGLEIAAVGMTEGPEVDEGPGAAYVVSRQDGRWVGERVIESDALLHAVCIDGGAVYVAGYDRKLQRAARSAAGWSAEVVGELPGAGKSAVAARGGIVVGCTDGSLVLFRRAGDGWTRETIDQRGSGRSRIAAHGEQIVASDDDGTLSIVGEERVEVFRSGAKLRGAVLADLDPSHAGLEAATAGYAREVTILLPAGGGFGAASGNEAAVKITPFVDADRIHHLASGNLDEDPEAELVACGYSGLLVVLDRR